MADATSHAPSISPERLLEASADAVLVVDGRGRIRMANRRAHGLFEVAGTLAGRAIEELIAGPLPRLPAKDATPVDGRTEDGTDLHLEAWLAPIAADEEGLLHITLRKAPSRANEVSFERILQHVSDGVLAVDDRGIIRFANHQAEVLFGYSPQGLVGKSMDVLSPEVELASQPEGVNLELNARRSDGAAIAADVSLSSVMTKRGELVIASVHDVTGRKQLESEQDAVDALELAGERDEERADFEVQLHQAQRLESIGRLAGGVAHDFNNMLGVIMMYTSFVSDRLDAGVSGADLAAADLAAMSTDLGAVKDVASRAAALTHKLLTFGRREVVAPEVVDLNDVVREMEDLLRRAMGENVADLRMVLADRVLPVKADRGQLDQVIMNLAVNARDAMPVGGTLEVRTSVVVIGGSAGSLPPLRPSPGEYVRFAMTDTGEGMSREVAARAFDPFFTTKGIGTGSGLGLATVYGIITQAGGDVSITSAPGRGTTVSVLLPFTHELPSTRRQPAQQPENIDGAETVLLVEDEQMFREPAVRILTAHGYHVLAASSARDALAVAHDYDGEIHVLVTDIVMPGASGKQLAIELAVLRPDTRVLFMSGYGWDVFDLEGLDEHTLLLDKPFAAAELLQKVRAALDEERP